jgi:hypothetical protein
MKKLLIFLTLITGLFALPQVVVAKDNDRDKWEDREKKRWKELRDDVRELDQSSGRLMDSARQGGVSRRTWDDVNYLVADARRVSAQFDRGQYNYDDFRNRVSRLQNAVNRTRDQIKYEQSSYRRYR